MDEPRPLEREVKAALRTGTLAEPFLASRSSFSPYMACGHGCAYCDGRAERCWVEGDFERDVVVRTNIADRLDRDLSRFRERAPVSVGSGISDACQPVEARTGLMRRSAEALLRHRIPASVLTKSSLVARDLDVWRGVNDAGGFTLSVSLVFTDDQTRRVFEPGASAVDDRVAALRAFKAAGCGIGVYAMPLLPRIADTGEELARLAELCRAAGADFVVPGGADTAAGPAEGVLPRAPPRRLPRPGEPLPGAVRRGPRLGRLPSRLRPRAGRAVRARGGGGRNRDPDPAPPLPRPAGSARRSPGTAPGSSRGSGCSTAGGARPRRRSRRSCGGTSRPGASRSCSATRSSPGSSARWRSGGGSSTTSAGSSWRERGTRLSSGRVPCYRGPRIGGYP